MSLRNLISKLTVQASFSINDEDTRHREVSELVSFHKVFPLQRAVIVIRDHEEQITESGLTIEAIPVWKWLLE